MVPDTVGAWLFHIWRSLVEKAGYKISDIPNTWDAFLDFFNAGAGQIARPGDAQHLGLGFQLTRRQRLRTDCSTIS